MAITERRLSPVLPDFQLTVRELFEMLVLG